MNTVLTLIDDDAGQESRLRAAVDLTHALSGHLVCLDVASQRELAEAGRRPNAENSSFNLIDRPRADRARALQHRLTREQVEWELALAAGDTADCVIQRSGLADIIVLDREPDTMSPFDAPSLTSRIAIRSRKPILAVPRHCEGFDVYGRALIAWDGSPSAMAALTAAVPLLKWSMSVTIFEAKSDSMMVPSEGAAAYLARHEIHANIRRKVCRRSDVAELLQDSATANAADYCVMGAYGHSPLYEAVFGGVTRRMLSTSPIPLVIAH